MSESEASGNAEVTQEKNNIAATGQFTALLDILQQFGGLKTCELQQYKLHCEQEATLITL